MSVTFNPNATHSTHNDDGHIADKEWNDWAQWYSKNKAGQRIDFGGQHFTLAELMKMKTAGLIADSGTPPSAVPAGKTDIAAQSQVVAHLHSLLEPLKGKIEDLQKKLNAKPPPNAAEKAKLELQIRTLQAKQKLLKDKQRAQLGRLMTMHGAKKVKGQAAWWKSAGATVPKNLQGKSGGGSVNYSGGKAATAQAQPKQAQQTPTNQAAAKGKASTTKGGGWGSASSGWGSQSMNGPKFSSAAYAQSLFMEDNIMKTWDGINKSQNRGQELMQLLFYYMRMAMSGDLTAMYNMMKAVLYIISKDKALQQVHMAKKLIQLQDESRKATDKLLNFNADQKDPNSQMAFTKMLQMVKSDSDSIATSQKLVSQMMEEMAQIVETLTNVTKGALDAAGRVLRTVSRFN